MSCDAPALLRWYPRLAGRIAWVPLGTYPTPVEPLALPVARSPDAEVWIKRDDRSAEPYGGNKVRKLEFLLAAARRDGATRVVTGGAAGSHHSLATAIYARMLGLERTLVLFPQPLTGHVRRILLLDHAMGAELRYCPRMEAMPAAMLLARVAHRHERTATLAYGGSSPIGTLGYVNAAIELAEQIARGELPRPMAVHVTAGTLGTAAGLALGFELAKLGTRIIATRVTSRVVANHRALRKLLVATARLLQRAGLSGLDPVAAMRRIELCHRQVGRGYGHETEAGRRATAALAAAGIAADPTYLAKTAAELLDRLPRETGGVHLFWNTLSSVEPAVPPGVDTEDLPTPFRRYLERGSIEPDAGASTPDA